MNYISDKRFQTPAIPAKCVLISHHGRHVYQRRRRIHSRITTLLLAALILLYGLLFLGLKTVADGGQVPVSFEPVEYKETGLSYLSSQSAIILPVMDPELPTESPTEVILETAPMVTPEISGVVEEPERWYTDWEWEITAIIIYQEAGGDACSDDTRYKVGEVFWNRVVSPDFPNTAEEVATDEAQYGTLHWTGIKWPDRAQLDPLTLTQVKVSGFLSILKSQRKAIYCDNIPAHLGELIWYCEKVVSSGFGVLVFDTF